MAQSSIEQLTLINGEAGTPVNYHMFRNNVCATNNLLDGTTRVKPIFEDAATEALADTKYDGSTKILE